VKNGEGENVLRGKFEILIKKAGCRPEFFIIKIKRGQRVAR